MTSKLPIHSQGFARRGLAWLGRARSGEAGRGKPRVPGYEQKLSTLQSRRGLVACGWVGCAAVWHGKVRLILSMIRNCLFTVKAWLRPGEVRIGTVMHGLVRHGKLWQGKETYKCIKK